MRSIQSCIVGLLLGSLLSGCTLLGQSLGGEAFRQGRMERLVADDFVRVMAQLEPLQSGQGPVSMSQPQGSFGHSLLLALRGAGYRVEIDNDLENERYLRYSVESIQNQFGSSQGYLVAAGGVTLSRDYSLKPKGVFPLSRMRVEGASSAEVLLGDDRFRRQDRSETVVTGIAPDPRFDEARALSGNPEGLPLMLDDNGRTVVDKDRVVRGNMYDTRESSFGDYLQRFESISREVVLFPDDSIRMMADTRAVLRELRADFNADTDVISVVGCSHGVTALPNGNEVLAEGRSQRVLEELVSLGIPEGQVLEEGCWADQPFDEMPPRGVVIELKRRKPS